jgi:L-asparaginase
VQSDTTPRIAFITTGGSIDKSYSPHTSSFEIEDPLIEEILAAGQVTFQPTVWPVLKKDSLEMTDNDREIIRKAVQECSADRIIITHGTDTIVQTGQFLKDFRRDKVIVLTGAFTPIRFQRSDAVLNLGMAIAAVQILEPGIYIAINGTIFPVDAAQKDLTDQVFRTVELPGRSRNARQARAASAT